MNKKEWFNNYTNDMRFMFDWAIRFLKTRSGTNGYKTGQIVKKYSDTNHIPLEWEYKKVVNNKYFKRVVAKENKFKVGDLVVSRKNSLMLGTFTAVVVNVGRTESGKYFYTLEWFNSPWSNTSSNVSENYLFAAERRIK